MASFAELLAWPTRELILLAELTPAKTVTGWTAASITLAEWDDGVTDWDQAGIKWDPGFVYKASFPAFAYTDLIAPAGLYRRVVGVRENGVDLTERSSAAMVASNRSSWYWDEVAGEVYVRSSSDADPDTFTAIQVFHTYYLASTGIILNRVDGDPSTGVYHQPWIQGEIPAISEYVEDLLHGIKITEGGRVSFTNGHKAWFQLIPDLSWKNKKVRLLVGGRYNGQELLRSQYVEWTTMLVDDLAPTEERCTIALKPLPRLLDRHLPVTPHTDTGTLGVGVKGTLERIGYGRAVIRPDLTDNTSHGVWTIADASKQTLFAVHAVRAVDKSTDVRTTLTLTTDYTVNLTTCKVTIVNATYKWQDYDIEVDVTGKPDGAGSYLKTFGAIAKDMLKTFAGATDADLDLASFAQADLDAPEELQVWIKEPRSMSSIFSSAGAEEASLERSAMGRLSQTVGGKWTVSIFDPGYTAASLTALRKEDFKRFDGEPKLEKIFSVTRVYYGYDHSRKEWSVTEKTDPLVQYESETAEPADLYTFLRNQADAVRLRDRYAFMNGGGGTEIEFEERGARLVQHSAGHKVLVTYDPAPFAGGKVTNKAFELIRLDKSQDNDLHVSGRLADLRGVGDLIGHWMDTLAPDWATATDEERGISGFWSDSAGLIDPLDPSTRDQSVWW